MLRILYIILLINLFNLTAKGQISLTIEINNLESNTGTIAMDFRDSKNTPVKEIIQTITNKKCVIIINNIKPGKYSFKYFHDKNNNKKLDTNWIGIPKEGYGFSNNANGMFGPPDFEETIFEIKQDSSLTCNIHYINF